MKAEPGQINTRFENVELVSDYESDLDSDHGKIVTSAIHKLPYTLQVTGIN
jgi:hypothetical protein